MTTIMLAALLGVIAAVGLLAILYRDLFISVLLLSVFSFLSALLFYVAHAPDVAITEAAVGAGMTTLIFVWAVRATASRATVSTDGSPPPGRPTGQLLLDILLVIGVGALLWVFLPPIEGGPTVIRDYIVLHGLEETGANNLVSAIYLGYRAFDTFGETIVLLCAVSGSIFFLTRLH